VVKRPANLEDVAFWPVRISPSCAHPQVTSLELTEMYLARLHRYNAKLNYVVTFLDELGRAEAKRPTPRSPPASTRAAARDSVGREGHHLGQGLHDHVGSPAFKDQSSTTTPASSRCCVRPARC
jgi:Asp-tRNA(Asn)/Glu-tRNA(Gln) amidotransferase A subunit family amidase